MFFSTVKSNQTNKPFN